MSPVTQWWPDLHRSLLDHRRWRPASWYHLACGSVKRRQQIQLCPVSTWKKLTLVKSQIITWFNHQLLHKKSVIALWFLCTLWLYTIQYIYIYIAILQIQSKTTRKTISLPSKNQPLLATPVFLPLFCLEVHWCSRSKEYPYIWALGP